MSGYRPRLRRLDEAERCLRPDGSRKSSYRSAAKARQAIRRHSADAKLSVYLCPVCGSWHLTSAPQPKGGRP